VIEDSGGNPGPWGVWDVVKDLEAYYLVKEMGERLNYLYLVKATFKIAEIGEKVEECPICCEEMLKCGVGDTTSISNRCALQMPCDVRHRFHKTCI
jgi:hypothetical protein